VKGALPDGLDPVATRSFKGGIWHVLLPRVFTIVQDMFVAFPDEDVRSP
jgi:hypothetical protein